MDNFPEPPLDLATDNFREPTLELGTDSFPESRRGLGAAVPLERPVGFFFVTPDLPGLGFLPVLIERPMTAFFFARPGLPVPDAFFLFFFVAMNFSLR
jgi:hypothetical protein